MSPKTFREVSENGVLRKCDSYQGTPSGAPQVLRDETAFRRWISEIGVSLRANMTNALATKLAVIVLLAVALGARFSAQAQKPTTANVTADLPPGPMQAKATTACLECHEARIILQQRLTKPAWAKEVDKMTKWGAVVDPADRDALIDYLSANFSPEKPVWEPQRTSGSGKRSK